VIRLGVPPDLTARERYGLDVLVDLSRLVVLLDPTANAVQLAVVDGPAQSLDQALRAGVGFESTSGEVRVSRAVLGHVTDLAGAAVEQAVTAVDRHDRVPSEANPLVGSHHEHEPIVQQWGVKLRAAVIAAADRRPVRVLAPWPDGRRWAAAITHDLDVVAGWPIFTLLRLAELGRRGHGRLLGRVLGSALTAVGRDPVGAGVRAILDAERAAGVSTTWFVLSGTPTPLDWLRGDVTYRLESRRVGGLVEDIVRGGHEIGLHGSFATASGATRFADERGRLARRLGAAPSGVRQHFLRMRPGRTHAAMRDAGFQYDASFGFPDRNGFRLGVADIIPAWLAESEPRLLTVPLIWMDRALSKYGGVEDPARWIAEALELSASCREVEGLWVGLWHPNLVPALGFPGAPAAFARLLRGLADGAPYFAPLHRLASWRLARRAVRARRVALDGQLELVTTHPSDWSMAVEDERGRIVDARGRATPDG
jgi:hypothetical protein